MPRGITDSSATGVVGTAEEGGTVDLEVVAMVATEGEEVASTTKEVGSEATRGVVEPKTGGTRYSSPPGPWFCSTCRQSQACRFVVAFSSVVFLLKF